MKSEDVRVLVGYRMQEAHTALADAEFLAASNRSAQSIVNRAYYAMFYAVLALAQYKGEIPAKHSGMLGLFDREFVHTGIFPREMSKCLHAAFEHRQESDYQAAPPADPEQAGETLAAARVFVECIGKWLESQYPGGAGKREGNN